MDYCTEHQITFTRSRPGNKNDGAHAEQKNWARVRELVGYLRYDTAAELALLNEIWEQGRIFTNYLLPQQKLVSKHRHGAKVIKKHDDPATPHQRAIAHPATRKREILALTGQLEELSLAKKTGRSKPTITIAKQG